MRSIEPPNSGSTSGRRDSPVSFPGKMVEGGDSGDYFWFVCLCPCHWILGSLILDHRSHNCLKKKNSKRIVTALMKHRQRKEEEEEDRKMVCLCLCFVTVVPVIAANTLPFSVISPSSIFPRRSPLRIPKRPRPSALVIPGCSIANDFIFIAFVMQSHRSLLVNDLNNAATRARYAFTMRTHTHVHATSRALKTSVATSSIRDSCQLICRLLLTRNSVTVSCDLLRILRSVFHDIYTGAGTTEWTYPSTAPTYPAPPVSSSGSYSPLPGGAFSYPGESLSHHPTTEPVPLPTVLSSENQQDTYTPNCVSMYSGHGTSPTTSLPLVPTRPSDPDIFAGGGTGNAGSPGYHYGSWTPGPATPVPVASHNYNPNYQGYYNNPSQNYITGPAPMVLYPQLYSTVNQNQIHLHLHGDLSEEQVTIAGGNLTISSIREIGVLGEESEQRNDVWRPY
ncbi:hypothetical protein ACFW04_012186 [Cataglyphis niger]